MDVKNRLPLFIEFYTHYKSQLFLFVPQSQCCAANLAHPKFWRGALPLDLQCCYFIICLQCKYLFRIPVYIDRQNANKLRDSQLHNTEWPFTELPNYHLA